MIFFTYCVAEDADVRIDLKVLSPDYVIELKTRDFLPWSLIAEPSRDQILTINNFTVDGQFIDVSSKAYQIEWSIDNKIYYGLNEYFKIIFIFTRFHHYIQSK